jgi:hypothetical protein
MDDDQAGQGDAEAQVSGEQFEALTTALMEAIFATGATRYHDGPARGAELIYSPQEIVSACNWVAATVVVQSGEYPTLRERKALANGMAKQFVGFCTTVEGMLANMGTGQRT